MLYSRLISCCLKNHSRITHDEDTESMSKALQIQNKYSGLHRPDRSTMASSPGSPPKVSGSPPTSFLDPIAQRALLEPILVDKQPVEGDYWYIVVAEWLEQLKKYLGIASIRKFYTNRHSSAPGPVITRKDYAHTVDVVHEEAWKLVVQWYGLSDNHKPIKLVVYNYNRVPAIEHNLNSFKMTRCNADAGDFHIARFSKLDKVGHIEWKMRELYFINRLQKTRLWGKAEPEDDWKSLLHRDKAIGKAMGMDSDFIRPIIAIETTDTDHLWSSPPTGTEPIQDEPSGPFYERDIFEDVTSAWEVDIHDQIDGVGKVFVEKLHLTFTGFVQKAKQYIDDRENCLRQRERDVCEREEYVDRRLTSVTEKEQLANAEFEAYQSRMCELERIYELKERELTSQMAIREQDLMGKITKVATERQILQSDKDAFHSEFNRMSEIRYMHEGKIKLDIGGHMYTTSHTTLSRDPNSMLAAMFSGRHNLKRDSDDGSYFIDRDGVHFRYILNYLRDGGIGEGTLPNNENVWRELMAEAEYYQIAGLVKCMENLMNIEDDKGDSEGADDDSDNVV